MTAGTRTLIRANASTRVNSLDEPARRPMPARRTKQERQSTLALLEPGLMGGEDYPASTGDICSGWTATGRRTAGAHDGSSDPRVRAKAVSLPMMVRKLAARATPDQMASTVRRQFRARTSAGRAPPAA